MRSMVEGARSPHRPKRIPNTLSPPHAPLTLSHVQYIWIPMTMSALPALEALATDLGARWTYYYYFAARAETD